MEMGTQRCGFGTGFPLFPEILARNLQDTLEGRNAVRLMVCGSLSSNIAYI